MKSRTTECLKLQAAVTQTIKPPLQHSMKRGETIWSNHPRPLLRRKATH